MQGAEKHSAHLNLSCFIDDVDEDGGSIDDGQTSPSSSDLNSQEQASNSSKDQDYIRLRHMTNEKMVLTKHQTRKVDRKERLAALNSKVVLQRVSS